MCVCLDLVCLELLILIFLSQVSIRSLLDYTDVSHVTLSFLSGSQNTLRSFRLCLVVQMGA